MYTTNPQHHGRRQQGFTLIEAIIFIVVVGAGLAGILSVSSTVVKSSADPMVRKQAMAIAESLLEEISLKAFQDPGGGTNGVTTCDLGGGTNRALWDDVCDYNGYASTGINDVEGNSIAALSNYNVTSVTVADSADLTGLVTKRITVTVTVPGGPDTITMTGFRANY